MAAFRRRLFLCLHLLLTHDSLNTMSLRADLVEVLGDEARAFGAIVRGRDHFKVVHVEIDCQKSVLDQF
jgi:hypothetical protein